MKVVVAHNRYASTQPSGENTIVDAEIAQLSAAGVQVVPFLRSSDEIAGLSRLGKATLPVSPIYNRASQQALAQLLRTERPNLLHLHNPYPLLSPWVVRTAHRHGIPVIQTVHNYRQVCSSGLYFRDGRVCHDCRGRRFGLPAVRNACYRGSAPQSLIMATTLAVHRGTWHGLDRYIALTSGIAAHLRDYGIDEQRITIKPNAVPDPGRPSSAPGSGFLFAARLSQEKGLSPLLEAWLRHREGTMGRLRIAGDGPQRDLAISAAGRRTDIEYLGPLDRDAMRDAIREAACVIAVPTWKDVLPTIALEALANGRPVLATNMGGLPSILGDSPSGGRDQVAAGTASADRPGGTAAVRPVEAGWLVEPGADAIAEALPVAADGAPALAGAARRRYEQTFEPALLTKRLIQIYEEVAG